jgi:hypothetical protein
MGKIAVTPHIPANPPVASFAKKAELLLVLLGFAISPGSGDRRVASFLGARFLGCRQYLPITILSLGLNLND